MKQTNQAETFLCKTRKSFIIILNHNNFLYPILEIGWWFPAEIFLKQNETGCFKRNERIPLANNPTHSRLYNVKLWQQVYKLLTTLCLMFKFFYIFSEYDFFTGKENKHKTIKIWLRANSTHAPSAGGVEYTDWCKTPPPPISVLHMTLNSLMMRFP